MGGRWALWVCAGLIPALAAVALLVWLLWWLWKRREQKEEIPGLEPKAPALEMAAPAPEPVAAAAEAAAPAQDDLEIIEGIGPRIAGVLREAGITTFAGLAGADVAYLRQVLEQADPRLLRLADPTTWPEQARLAAAGEWEALRQLQEGLKGGRRE